MSDGPEGRVVNDLGELRQAAVLAEALLRFDAARQYGLITGGFEVNVERCEAAIAEAKDAGVTYGEDEIDGAIVALVSEASS